MTSALAGEPGVDMLDTVIPADAKIGTLIINADDWGRSVEITDRILDCALSGVVSSTSAMVFLEDSERAADLALQHNIDTGLHLNLTTPLSAPNCPVRLREQQQKLANFLRAYRLCRAIYHPGLAGAFDFVVRAQLDEYQRLYRRPAARIDGHHHMHLCANVQLQRLLPQGTIVRRNFSFEPGEKSTVNRLYRQWQDKRLLQRHRSTDYFFSLPPMNPSGRLEKICSLATHSSVEVETHPVNRDEFAFLMNGELTRLAKGIGVARDYSLAERRVAGSLGSRS